MSINKNALIRYQTLDRCFRNNGRKYFLEDLLHECNKALLDFDPSGKGIQKRQLYDDIRFMESDAGWSIALEKLKEGRKTYYRYEDVSFSISNQALNDVEAEKIKAALQVFSRFSGTPQFEWVNEMIPMLESKFGLIDREKEIISFDSNIDLKGIHFLTPLFNAIIYERVLKVSYQDFKSTAAYDLIFHPYYLKQYNNRWFVFGKNEHNKIPTWNLALDRIESLKEVAIAYEPSIIEWDDYFYDLVGVTKPENAEVENILLQFTPNISPYIITKPIHPSQKHKHTEEGLEVSIKAIPNYELEKLILSFGEDVLVLAPQTLKARISSRLRISNEKYV